MKLQLCFFCAVFFVWQNVVLAIDKSHIGLLDLKKEELLDYENNLSKLSMTDPKTAREKYSELVCYLRSLFPQELRMLRKKILSQEKVESISVAVSVVYDFIYKGYSCTIEDFISKYEQRHFRKTESSLGSAENLLRILPLLEPLIGKTITVLDLSRYNLMFLPVTILQLPSLKKIYVAPYNAHIETTQFYPNPYEISIPDSFKAVKITSLIRL
jgi:hypothetical protein